MTLQLRVLSSAEFCHVDWDAGGSYSAGEPVVVDVIGSCSGSVTGRDLRLTTSDGHRGGERVLAGPERGSPLGDLGGAEVWFLDADGNGQMSPEDTVYANVNAPTLGTVSVGDVRLSPFEDLPAFSVVKSGDPDMSHSLLLLGEPDEVIAFIDSDGDRLLGEDEVVYLRAKARVEDLVGYGDLRLTDVDSARSAGSFVDIGDADGALLLRSFSAPICAADGFSPDRTPMFLTTSGSCTGKSSRGDVRMVTTSHGLAGTRVDVVDEDIGLQLYTVVDSLVAFVDLDGDGETTFGDAVYLDLVGVDEAVVSIGDLRLSPFLGPGGARVEENDADVGMTLMQLEPFRNLLAFSPGTDSDLPTRQDPYYLDIDGDDVGRVEPGDVRLVAFEGRPFGGPASLLSGEALVPLRSGSASVCFLPGSGTDYSTGDEIYLRLSGGCSKVAPGDIRLGGDPDTVFGSVVREGDAEIGASVTALSDAPEWRYLDVDGDGVWSIADTMYLDIRSQSSFKVSIGDIRVSPYQEHAAGLVRTGHPDLDLTLRHLASVTSVTDFSDSDGDGNFDPGDVAYLNADAVGSYATVLDVRLTPLPVAPVLYSPTGGDDTPSSTKNPDEASTATIPTRSPPKQTLNDSPTDSPTGQPSPTGAPTPG
ncbi:MAG: hypothetical protein KY455_13685, partial [Euryarchaeota archaeon]|nr:hypothetical protein [Euryarchaeota archaeon]